MATIPDPGRVTSRAPDGSEVNVEWVDERGDLVEGTYILVSWLKPPREITNGPPEPAPESL